MVQANVHNDLLSKIKIQVTSRTEHIHNTGNLSERTITLSANKESRDFPVI